MPWGAVGSFWASGEEERVVVVVGAGAFEVLDGEVSEDDLRPVRESQNEGIVSAGGWVLKAVEIYSTRKKGMDWSLVAVDGEGGGRG